MRDNYGLGDMYSSSHYSHGVTVSKDFSGKKRSPTVFPPKNLGESIPAIKAAYRLLDQIARMPEQRK